MFSKNLKTLRKTNKETQKDLARILQVGRKKIIEICPPNLDPKFRWTDENRWASWE